MQNPTGQTTLTGGQALDLAFDCMQAGDYARARALCEAALAAVPGHARALYLLGCIAFENDEPGTAIDWLERAIAADPEAADAYPYLEAVYTAENRQGDALRTAERARDAREVSSRFGDLPRHARKYQRLVESLRTSRYMDYPREVAIETLAVCNAACSFCPYPGLERKGDRMPDALIEKIIEDLAEIPRDLPFIVSPFKVSDPLLDVRLFDILQRCNERLPNAMLRVFTNGSPLTARHLSQLVRVQNLEHLWVSLNHHDPERYEQVMQLPWKRTIEKLELLHRTKAAGDFPVPVVVSRVGDGSDDDARFAAFLRERFPLFRPALVPSSEWLGQVQGLLGSGKVLPVGCGRWFELSITATGEVAFCCMDGKAEYPIGNVSTTNVLEVYNDPAYRMFRERYVTRIEGAPCRGCTNL